MSSKRLLIKHRHIISVDRYHHKHDQRYRKQESQSRIAGTIQDKPFAYAWNWKYTFSYDWKRERERAATENTWGSTPAVVVSFRWSRRRDVASSKRKGWYGCNNVSHWHSVPQVGITNRQKTQNRSTAQQWNHLHGKPNKCTLFELLFQRGKGARCWGKSSHDMRLRGSTEKTLPERRLYVDEGDQNIQVENQSLCAAVVTC